MTVPDLPSLTESIPRTATAWSSQSGWGLGASAIIHTVAVVGIWASGWLGARWMMVSVPVSPGTSSLVLSASSSPSNPSIATAFTAESLAASTDLVQHQDVQGRSSLSPAPVVVAKSRTGELASGGRAGRAERNTDVTATHQLLPHRELSTNPKPSEQERPTDRPREAKPAELQRLAAVMSPASMPASSQQGVETQHVPLVAFKPGLPEYPADAYAAGITGVTQLLVQLNDQGEVVHLKLLRSSGHESLDAAARRWVKQWRFAAPEDNWSRTHRQLRVPVRFQIYGG